MSLPSDNPVLDARALSFPADASVLRGVDLAVGEGETVALHGPAGAGKTVLLRCLTGQLTPGGGSVWANGKAFHLFSPDRRRAFQRRSFGLVPQQVRFVPELTLVQNTALPLVFTGIAREAAAARAAVWLSRFELGEDGDRRIAALPEEALRRAALARGMVTDPLVLFADEPLAGLTDAQASAIARMLLSIARTHGTSTVCFTREESIADKFERRIDLVEGRTRQRPVSAAQAKAARTRKATHLQPAVAPRAVTVSVPLPGLAGPQQPVGLPTGAPSHAMSAPPAPSAETGVPAGMSGTVTPFAAAASASAAASAAAAARPAPENVPAPPQTEPAPTGSFRPPVPPTHPRHLGGLPVGAPSHLDSGHAQVTP